MSGHLVSSINQSIVENGEMALSSYQPKENLDLIRPFPILFMSYCVGGQSGNSFCSNPSLVQLNPYSETDMSVRQFISLLFGKKAENQICKKCHVLDRLHIRRMVHANKGVHVISRELHHYLPHSKVSEKYNVVQGAEVTVESV